MLSLREESLEEGQQWDGEMVKNIVGSPENWRLNASEEPQLVELEDRDDPELNPELKPPPEWA